MAILGQICSKVIRYAFSGWWAVSQKRIIIPFSHIKYYCCRVDVIVKKILNKHHHGGDIYRLKKQKIALKLQKS